MAAIRGWKRVKYMQKRTSRPDGANSRGAHAPAGGSHRSNGYRRPGARRRPTGIAGLMMRISDLTSTPRGWVLLGGFFLALVLVILLIGLLLSRGAQRDVVNDNPPAPAITEAPTIPEDGAPESDLPDAGIDAAQTPEGIDTADSSADDAATTPAANTGSGASAVSEAGFVRPSYLANNPETWRDGTYVPEPQGEGYLPVFMRAEREDKVIAITVDDCFQTGNLEEIIKLAEAVDGKLTIFPIGSLLKRTELQDVIRYAHDKGFEIENHTWNHDSLYNFTNEDMVQRVFDQDRAVDLVLGVNYYTHFLRPRGGDDRNDLRTHAYIGQLGYYGIAHWQASGGESIESIKKALKPGIIYLFHCTDKDLTKLREFIPYATSQGYKLVTMNELFGYEKNYEEPLTDDPKTREIIPLEPYERDYKKIKPTTYDWAAWEIQEKLIEKGFLTGTPDGVYGPGTAASAAEWQKSEGFEGDGVLTTEQQRKLFGVS